ncbi:hypothetical protein [Paraburkholderia hayleyella]|uniref:glycoside hydrolase family 130 protein n=1 Tax=Paraburkholderia hayleyella TaxID=2152889 RepID=UPI001291851C|nr:hypothetical protein [Paraburkholderia hayleyella]
MKNQRLRFAALTLLFLFSAALHARQTTTTFSLAPSFDQPAPVAIELNLASPKPVLERGKPGQWDAIDVLNPSVIRFNGKLYNYYSGYDGKIWHTGLATSIDGIQWEKYKGNPILSPSPKNWDVSYISANGAAIEWKGKILYFYQGVDRKGHTAIGLATSRDGIRFIKQPKPVLTAGEADSWEDSAVGDPYVIARNGYLYLYYLGQNHTAIQRLGVARSQDGITWQRSSANPVLDVGAYGTFDENGLGEPSVAYTPPYFYMLYTGRDKNEQRNIGYAISTDGIHWKKMSVTGLIAQKQLPSWASKVVCDTTLLENSPGKWQVWFGGGDKPHPGQNLNGQIGLATLDLTHGRNASEFDANADWSKTTVRSTDVLRGSFAIEGEPGKRQAWVGPQTHATLVVDKARQNKSLTVTGWIPATMISRALKTPGKVTLTLWVNGKKVASHDYSHDDTVQLSAPWSQVAPALGTSRFAEVEIRASRSFVPAQAGLSPDIRRLSFMIQTIRFQ